MALFYNKMMIYHCKTEAMMPKYRKRFYEKNNKIKKMLFRNKIKK
jgi:hypothetical protein